MTYKKKPNILFIMTDQQRYDTLGCINPEIITPNFDQLAGDSILFKHAYCSNPSCVPSRAAIMTGKYPSECGAPSFITPLPENETTFMKRLQDAGYYTAVIGKQHFAGSKIDKGYDEATIIDCHFANVNNEESDKYVAFLREHGVEPGDEMDHDLISGGTWKTKEAYHFDYFIGDLGKEWLRKKAKEATKQPWFFTLSFPGPHHPYDCEGTKYADMYPLESISSAKTTYADLDQKPKQFKEMDGYAHIYLKDFTHEQFLRTKRSYYANMTLIDEKVGQVLQQLKDDGLYDDTLIIFTTDHGDFMGDFGLVEKLQCLSDSLMRVPLIVKPPIKNFDGFVSKDLVTNIDIASTCLKAAEADIPYDLSNYPYTTYWMDQQKKVRDYIYMEARDIRGILKNGIKTMHYVNRDYGELYDMTVDPLERDNQWENPDYNKEKLDAYRLMMNHLYQASPEWHTPWNYGTPEI